VNREAFEELVDQAVASLPAEFAERLDNVAITIEDYPSRRQRSGSRLGPRSTLLGLYEGVPLTARGTDYGMVLPDRITIFQKPIESICRNDAEVVEEVRKVVLHEIAHHFGIGDARLDELEGEE
jgi:predicted Zn-dependent protease with MMP-like domain